MKARIQFAKYGKMIYIGHLDVMRYFQKAFKRAGLDMKYSQGFSPRPVLSFAAPLGVGIKSCGEYADIELESTKSSSEMIALLNSVMAEGIEVLDYRLLKDDAKNAMSCVSAADYCLTFKHWNNALDVKQYLEGLKDFLTQESIEIEKETKKGSRLVDIRPLVFDYYLKDNSDDCDGPAVFLQVSTGSSDNLKPELVLDAYHKWDKFPCSKELMSWDISNISICRLEIYTDVSDNDERKLIPLKEMGRKLEQNV